MDQKLIQQLMATFGLKSFNPVQLITLFKLKDKVPADITDHDVREFIALLGLNVDEEKIMSLTSELNNDSSTSLLDWIALTVNQDKLVALMAPKADPEPFVTQCPLCLAVHVVQEELVQTAKESQSDENPEPFVVQCPHCLGVHVVPEDQL